MDRVTLGGVVGVNFLGALLIAGPSKLRQNQKRQCDMMARNNVSCAFETNPTDNLREP
jgi:hypothetical protein